MLQAIQSLLRSRKFVITIFTVIGMVAAKYGLDWSPSAMAAGAAPFIALVLAIAHEDSGAKSAGTGTTTATTQQLSGDTVQTTSVAVASGSPASVTPTELEKLVADTVAAAFAEHSTRTTAEVPR